MEELESSELGTQEYWEGRYEMEIKNFTTHGDPGEIWFGEDIVDRILQWIMKEEISKQSSIIDLGCGNGMLLIELANEGFENLFGVDYSEKAIKLAKSIAEKHNIDVKYSTCDILNTIPGSYKIIHDKGTYDAVSLSNQPNENRKKYIENVHKCLENDGCFIITSCNWTHDELDVHFAGKFEMYKRIPTPQYKFGGKVGNVVTSVVYKKV